MERAPIPATLLQCEPDPDIPAGDLTDRDVVAYLLALWAAGDDCRNALDKVRQLQEAKP